MTRVTAPRSALHPSERAARSPVAWAAWRKAALIAVPIVAALTLSAQVALSAIVAAPPAAPTARVTAAITARDRFPGAASFDATAANASPAEGTTGTIALPPEPSAIPAPARFETTITAAQPFSMARASAVDRGRALECLTAAIYYEAASEPDDGQRGVAQVVLNRVRHPAFPATVCGVVYQGSERASGCQFSFACDGAMARTPARAGWARAMRNAIVALHGQVFAPVGLATHYHTYAVTPAWNRTLVMTDAIGAHFFHRWKGYWGTALAFRQSYQGGEPAPGPHAKTNPPALLAPMPMPMLAAIAVPPAPVTPPTQIMPDHADSGTLIASAVMRDDSQVLDRWKDSGKPLR